MSDAPENTETEAPADGDAEQTGWVDQTGGTFDEGAAADYTTALNEEAAQAYAEAGVSEDAGDGS